MTVTYVSIRNNFFGKGKGKGKGQGLEQGQGQVVFE